MIDLLQPIPGAAPAGSNARYEPAFLQLSEEIGKLTAIDLGKPDWDQVATDAITVLSTLSKDLLAAVYFTRARAELAGISGLIDGLTVVREILTTYWDSGFPAVSRPAARISALRWLSDGLPALSGAPAEVATATMLLDELTAVGQTHFSNEDLGFARITGLLSAPPTVTANPAGERPAPGRPASTAALNDRHEALRLLRDGAAWFTTHEPHSPVGLLVQRAIAMAGKPFDEVFRDLLTNHQAAQHELWQVLGLPPPQ